MPHISEYSLKKNNRALTLPENTLILLVGLAGSGKSSFTKRFFQDTEIISSDQFRAAICDCEVDMDAAEDAYTLMKTLCTMRLKRGRLTLMDATNLSPKTRKQYLDLAKTHQFHCVAVIFNIPYEECVRRDRLRTYRTIGTTALKRQHGLLLETLESIDTEGFDATITLNSQEEVNAYTVHRDPIAKKAKHPPVPFDIIGDIHGSLENLVGILRSLGYVVNKKEQPFTVSHPQGRKIVFIGDVKKRESGPKELQEFIEKMIATNQAINVDEE